VIHRPRRSGLESTDPPRAESETLPPAEAQRRLNSDPDGTRRLQCLAHPRDRDGPEYPVGRPVDRRWIALGARRADPSRARVPPPSSRRRGRSDRRPQANGSNAGLRTNRTRRSCSALGGAIVVPAPDVQTGRHRPAVRVVAPPPPTARSLALTYQARRRCLAAWPIEWGGLTPILIKEVAGPWEELWINPLDVARPPPPRSWSPRPDFVKTTAGTCCEHPPRLGRRPSRSTIAPLVERSKVRPSACGGRNDRLFDRRKAPSPSFAGKQAGRQAHLPLWRCGHPGSGPGFVQGAGPPRVFGCCTFESTPFPTLVP